MDEKASLKPKIDKKPKDPENVALGDRIRKRRENLNLTREALSGKTGLSVRFLTTIETGAGGLSLATLRIIATALNLSYDFLLTGNEEVQLKNDCQIFLDHIRPKDRSAAIECITTLSRLYSKMIED